MLDQLRVPPRCRQALHNLKPLIQAVHFMKICREKILSAVTLLIIQSVLVGGFALLTSLRILRSKTTPSPPCVSSSAQLKKKKTILHFLPYFWTQNFWYVYGNGPVVVRWRARLKRENLKLKYEIFLQMKVCLLPPNHILRVNVRLLRRHQLQFGTEVY